MPSAPVLLPQLISKHQIILDMAFTYAVNEVGILHGRKDGLPFTINMGTILHISVTEPHI